MEGTEKVYCMCPSHDNTNLLAELINAKNNGTDAAEMAALFSNQNGMNNPMWLLWALVFGNGFGGWGGNRGGYDNAEINSRLDSIERQAQNNHNTDLLYQGITGNHNAIHELAGALNMSAAGLSDRISDVRNAITKVGGDVGMSAERVLNGVLLGNKDLTAAVQNCCCENKQLVQKMGYENQLGQKDTMIAMRDQTYTINERLTGIANGLQKGFSDIGYILAQNKCEITTNQDRNTQRVLDTLNGHWSLETSQALQDEKFKNSQLQQNLYFRDLLEKKESGSCCGCGC